MRKIKTAFITLTNNGYLHYTLNCIKSLENIEFKEKLKCYAIGKQAYKTLVNKGIDTSCINDEENTKFETFRAGNWANVTLYKFEIIYQNLQNHDFVCFTDGDIVFENDKFHQYCIDKIGESDMLIQNDTLNDDDDTDLCSGFMFIKSNENTLNIFNPSIVKANSNIQEGWDDQVYINTIKDNLNYTLLPLSLFPNGGFYRLNYKTLAPYLIHFNWNLGHDKAFWIIRYKKWKSIRLFFNFMGMLNYPRLIRISVNKLITMYNK